MDSHDMPVPVTFRIPKGPGPLPIALLIEDHGAPAAIAVRIEPELDRLLLIKRLEQDSVYLTVAVGVETGDVRFLLRIERSLSCSWLAFRFAFSRRLLVKAGRGRPQELGDLIYRNSEVQPFALASKGVYAN